MEEMFTVYSTLAETTVFQGTKEQCNEYKSKHENSDNALYVLSQGKQ